MTTKHGGSSEAATWWRAPACAALLCLQVFATTWVRQNPLPVGPNVHLYGVCMIGARAACVVGQGGAMSITRDGGLSWTGLYPGTSGDLRAAWFVDSLHGWVVGDTGFIAATGDGGASWVPQNSATGFMLNDVQFVDTANGYAVGDTGTILKAVNGGADWIGLGAPTTGNYSSVWFLNADTGWVSGSGVIARTNDGGVTWTRQGPSNSRYPCIHFADKDTGWAAEAFGAVYKTTDGGANWAVVYNFPSADLFWLYDLDFADTRTGWAAGAFQVSGTNNDGRIMVTRDGGATWSRQVQSAQTLLGVAFNDTSNGWAVGLNGALLKTEAGGDPWDNGVLGPTNDLNDVFFTSKDVGWAVGGSSWDSTLILHTVDAGSTWSPQQTPVNNVGLESVFFVDSLTGWAAGQDMTVLKTVDGGASWSGQSGTTTDLQCVFFADADNGWAVGGNSLQSAVVRKTQDGGGVWQPVAVPVTAPLNDVFFLNADTGWVAGARGTVLRTSNAGQSFTDLSDSALGTVVDVRFFDVASGWAVGSNGAFVTNDGGATWQRKLTAGTNLGACFLDMSTVYVITGSNSSPFPGHIYRTTDEGLTWESQFLQNGVLWSGGVHFEDDSTGWVVSGGGAILHTTDGGGSDWNDVTGMGSSEPKRARTEPAGTIRWFSGAGGVRFTVENAGPARLELAVYDQRGRLLWRGAGRPGHDGDFTFRWSPRSSPSGVFVARARQGNRQWKGSAILIK